MRLTDLMSGMRLDVYPQIALVIFLGVFAVVVIRLFGRTRGAELDRAAMLPLDDQPCGRGERPAECREMNGGRA